MPAAMEAGFENKLRALIGTHEEARRMWMEERRQVRHPARAPSSTFVHLPPHVFTFFHHLPPPSPSFASRSHLPIP